MSPTPGPLNKILGNGSESNPYMLEHNEYIISISPIKNDKGLVELLKSSPETTQGQTSVSSSINTSYSAHAGFFGNTLTGGVSGSQSFGHTQSFSTQDVETIYNRQGNEASWTFRLEPHSNLSHSTFQPFLQALWKSDELYVEAHNNTIPFCIKFSSRGKIMLKEHIMSKSEFDKYKNEKPSFWGMLGDGLATTWGG